MGVFRGVVVGGVGGGEGAAGGGAGGAAPASTTNWPAMEEFKWHNCWLKLSILPRGAMLGRRRRMTGFSCQSLQATALRWPTAQSRVPTGRPGGLSAGRSHDVRGAGRCSHAVTLRGAAARAGPPRSPRHAGAPAATGTRSRADRSDTTAAAEGGGD